METLLLLSHVKQTNKMKLKRERERYMEINLMMMMMMKARKFDKMNHVPGTKMKQEKKILFDLSSFLFLCKQFGNQDWRQEKKRNKYQNRVLVNEPQEIAEYMGLDKQNLFRCV